MKNKHVDAIIVGAGAGGGVVAKELSVNGLHVVLFERGNWPSYEKLSVDELFKRRERFYQPDVKKNPRVFIKKTDNGITVNETPNFATHIGANVGSATVTYGAMSWRFMPEDFKMKTTYGEVEGSTLDDWPISYNDLEPYYEKAEWEIGVAGDDSENPFAAPRKKEYPMPPFENNDYGKILADASTRLGLHPFPIPMSRNSIPYNDRTACIRNRTCSGYQCPVNAKNGTHNTVIPVGLASGNLELRTNCQVSEVLMGENDKAIGIKYYDENDEEFIQTADIVIISASAIETARLLLNSKTEKFPNGLGNNNDWVGRNLQAHTYVGADAIFENPIHQMTGPGATFALCDYNHHNKDIIGGALIANEFFREPIAFSGIRPPGAPKWGVEHKEYQEENFFKFASLRCPVQEMPNFNSRVFLYPDRKDHWGRPIIAISGESHPLDRRHSEFMVSKTEEIFKEAGAKQIWKVFGKSALVHQAGTCRMGDDPNTSVVNKYGQVHDIENLYIADGSTFVTSGGFNPSLTIFALGYWISDHIVKKYKG